MPGEARTLVWLSFNRSGTNYLTDLLAALPYVSSMTEVFNRRSVQVHSFQDSAGRVASRLASLEAWLDVDPGADATITARMSSPVLLQRVRAAPVATIRHLARHNATPLSSLKIFPQHLDRDALDEVLAAPEVLPCVFWRNPLDTYISGEKRKQSKAFRDADTTGLRVTLDPGKYLKFLKKRARFFRYLKARVDRPFIALTYEEVMRLADDRARIACLDHHLASFRTAPGIRPVRPSPIQDRAASWDQKVANPDAFRRDCEVLGLPLGRDLVDGPA